MGKKPSLNDLKKRLNINGAKTDHPDLSDLKERLGVNKHGEEMDNVFVETFGIPETEAACILQDILNEPECFRIKNSVMRCYSKYKERLEALEALKGHSQYQWLLDLVVEKFRDHAQELDHAIFRKLGTDRLGENKNFVSNVAKVIYNPYVQEAIKTSGEW